MKSIIAENVIKTVNPIKDGGLFTQQLLNAFINKRRALRHHEMTVKHHGIANSKDSTVIFQEVLTAQKANFSRRKYTATLLSL